MNTMKLVPAFLLAGVVTSLLVLLVRGDKGHERIMGLPKRTVATREVLPAPLLRPYSHFSPHITTQPDYPPSTYRGTPLAT